MSLSYRLTDFFEGAQRKKPRGAPALSDVDRSLILVEGIVFVLIRP